VRDEDNRDRVVMIDLGIAFMLTTGDFLHIARYEYLERGLYITR